MLLSRSDAGLVGEDDNAMIGGDECQNLCLHVLVRPDPVVGVLGEFGTALDVDECLIHVEAGNAS